MPLFEHCNLQCLQLVSSVSSENIEISESIVSNILSVNRLCGGATSISDSIFSLFHLWSFLFAAGHRWPPEFIIYAAVAFHQKKNSQDWWTPPRRWKVGDISTEVLLLQLLSMDNSKNTLTGQRKVLVIQYLAIVVFCVPLAVLPRTWCSDGPSRALGGQTAV